MRRRAGSSVQRSPAWAAARRGEATGRSWSRPTRATARSSPSARGERSSPTWSLTTSSTGAGEAQLRAAFAGFVAGLDGPAVLCADDPGASALAEHAAPTRHLWDLAGERLPDRGDRHGGHRRAASSSSTRATGSPSRCQRPRARTTPGTRRPRWRWRTSWAWICRPPRPPWVASGGWPAGSRSAARPPVSCSWTATTTCRRRWRPPWRRPVPGSGGGSCAASSRTATAAPRRWGGPSPTASRTLTSCSSPASTRRGRRPEPGSSGKIVVDAVLDAHPWKHVAWLPTLDDVVAYLAGSAPRRRSLPHARGR